MFATFERLRRAITLEPFPDTRHAGQQPWEQVKQVVITLSYIEPGDGSPTDQELTEHAGGIWGTPFWEVLVNAHDPSGASIFWDEFRQSGYPATPCACKYGETIENAIFHAQDLIEILAFDDTRDQLAAYARRDSRVVGYRSPFVRLLLRLRASYWGVRGWLSDLIWMDLSGWLEERRIRQLERRWQQR